MSLFAVVLCCLLTGNWSGGGGLSLKHYSEQDYISSHLIYDLWFSVWVGF